MIALLANLALLVGAHLVALQIRLRIPWGNSLGTEYQGDPPLIYGIALGTALLTFLITAMAHRLGTHPLSRYRLTLLPTLTSLVLMALGVVVLLPDVSQLQMIYFGITGVVLALLTVAYPNRLMRHKPPGALWANLRTLVTNRALVGLWLRYTIQARYSQTLLGILWIILLPLATSLVLALAFSQILRVEFGVPFVSFFLSGLVFWGLLSQGTLNGLTALVAKMGLLNQVPLPREIPVLLALGEALVDLIFTFGAMLIVNALNGIFPNAYYVYLIPLLAIFIAFTLGIMCIVSCLTVIVRDMPQLVSVILQLFFYLTPILYPVASIPDHLRVLVLINPLAGVIQGVRDVILYARPPDPLTLYYPAVVAAALLYTGYAFFLANKDRVTDYA